MDERRPIDVGAALRRLAPLAGGVGSAEQIAGPDAQFAVAAFMIASVFPVAT